MLDCFLPTDCNTLTVLSHASLWQTQSGESGNACRWWRLNRLERKGSVTMMLIAWVSVYGHRSVSVYLNRTERCSAANSTGGRKRVVYGLRARRHVWNLHARLCLKEPFMCVLITVYSEGCWLCETQPPLCSLKRFNPLALPFRMLCSPLQNLPSAENVIALLSLVTFSLFQQMTKLLQLSIPLGTRAFSSRSLLLLKDKC